MDFYKGLENSSGRSWRKGEGVSISNFWADLMCSRNKPVWMWILNTKYKDKVGGTWCELLWCGERKEDGQEVKEGLISMGMDEEGLNLTQIYRTVIPPREKYKVDEDMLIECQGTTSRNRLSDINRLYNLYGVHHPVALEGYERCMWDMSDVGRMLSIMDLGVGVDAVDMREYNVEPLLIDPDIAF